MNCIVTSSSNMIEIKLKDDNYIEFQSLKQNLGYNFFSTEESRSSVSFSHFDFFLNMRFIIRQIKAYNIELDVS